MNVLQSIEDVTARVNAAVKPEMTPAEAFRARRAVINTIEKESFDKTGLRSDVITLYQGGLYHLYRYKKYTDVRLVFAPEQQTAFFGGDPDNFEYPRYDLDICFFRVYENGKPAKIKHYLEWSKAGAGDGELVFVSGHPGNTDRLNTVAHLDFLRDRVFPFTLRLLFRREVLLRTYSERIEENARQAMEELFGVAKQPQGPDGRPGRFADSGDHGAKAVPRNGSSARPSPPIRGSRSKSATPWYQVAGGDQGLGKILDDNSLLERGTAFNSHLFAIARALVRMAEETAKPNPQRLREYRESSRESLTMQLFSEAPIYDDLEIVKLADSLSMYLDDRRGGRTRWSKQVLAGKSPQERAAELVRGTQAEGRGGAEEARRRGRQGDRRLRRTR